MAALTQDRNTPRRYVERVADAPVLNAVKIFNGSLIMKLAANANARPAADTATGVILGVAEQQVDNTAGAAGAKRVRYRKGVFKFANGGAFTEADIGGLCYVQDDQTVTTAAAATNDVLVGKIENVDSDGVWVAIDL